MRPRHLPVRCLLWVISGHSSAHQGCPLYPPIADMLSVASTSAKCHKRTGLRLHGVAETVNGIAAIMAVSLSGDGKRLRLGRCSKQASTAP
jgi:hypothetical protein